MVTVSEFLANPSGSDAAGEWIELYNSDAQPAHLAGWKLGVKNGKTFSLASVHIEPAGFIVLPRSRTKLTLRNRDEAVILMSPDGEIQDRLAFAGTMSENKSVVRSGAGSTLADPTPYAPNPKASEAALIGEIFTPGVLVEAPTDWYAWQMFFGCALLVPAAVFILLARFHDLRQHVTFENPPPGPADGGGYSQTSPPSRDP